MPELPEVETYRRYFEETSLYQPISNVYVEDTKLLTTDYDTLNQQLKNHQFIGTKRVGKNLFGEKISISKVGGRTTYFCANRQVL